MYVNALDYLYVGLNYYILCTNATISYFKNKFNI